MALARGVQTAMDGATFIRRMFEDGARLKREHGAENVFDFSLGNPSIEPPERVRLALVAAAETTAPGSHRYMPNAGFPDVRAAVARYLAGASGHPIEGRHVVMTAGAGGALNVVFKALLDPGDEVIAPTPCFVEYRFYLDNVNAVLVPAPTDERFQLDLQAIEDAITPRTKAVLINSPNNPTGAVFPREDLAALGEILERASKRFGDTIYLISDEPYRHIAYDVEVPWVFDAYPHSVAITSHSKDLSLPGDRIGYLSVSPRMQDVDRFMAALIFTQRTLGFTNASATVQRAVAHLQGVTVDVGVYRRMRDRLFGALTEMGYEMVKPDGAFYLFPRAPIDDDFAFVAELQQERVLTVPGSGFGRSGHFRIAFCVTDETIERSLPAFRRAASRHGLC